MTRQPYGLRSSTGLVVSRTCCRGTWISALRSFGAKLLMIPTKTRIFPRRCLDLLRHRLSLEGSLELLNLRINCSNLRITFLQMVDLSVSTMLGGQFFHHVIITIYLLILLSYISIDINILTTIHIPKVCLVYVRV